MKNLVIYVHGKGGNAEEAEHFKHKPFFENADVFKKRLMLKEIGRAHV